MHVGAGIAILVLAVLYLLATGVPLFLLAFSAHKSLSYLAPRLRSSRLKRFVLPALSGILVAVAGLIFHCTAFELTGDSSGMKISLLLSALTLLLSLVFVLAWVILAIRARRKKDSPPALPPQ
jgi:hypothetical protein